MFSPDVSGLKKFGRKFNPSEKHLTILLNPRLFGVTHAQILLLEGNKTITGSFKLCKCYVSVCKYVGNMADWTGTGIIQIFACD